MSTVNHLRRALIRATIVSGIGYFFVYFLSLLRTKILSGLLGPAGVGVTALAQPLVDWFTLVFGLGIATSGARSVAKEKDNDNASSDRMATTIFHVTSILGLVGGLLLLLNAGSLALLFLGDTELTNSIYLLSIAVVLGPLTDGFRAVLRGARQVKLLTIVSVATAFVSLGVSAAIWSALGIRGIALSISATTIITCIGFYLACRRGAIDFRAHSLSASLRFAKPMVQMGFWIALSAVFAQTTSIATRLTIKSYLGLDAIGLFAAAFAVSGLFSSLLLAGMGTDFFPRLASAWPNQQQLGDAISEQTILSLVMALPGLVATISFSDQLIDFLFSKDFRPATEIMPYLAIASLIKFISWPLAYIPLVTGQSKTYAAIESTLHLSGLVFCLASVSYLGFFGIGVAMLAQNSVGLVAAILVTSKSTGYLWPLRILFLAIFSVSVAIAVSTVKEVLPATTGLVVNTIVTLALACGSGIYLRSAASATAEDGTGVLPKN